MVRPIGSPLEPINNVYPACQTLRVWRRRHRISLTALTALLANEAAAGQDLVQLTKSGWRPPVDQAYLSGVERGDRLATQRLQDYTCRVLSKFEGRAIEPQEVFPELTDSHESIGNLS